MSQGVHWAHTHTNKEILLLHIYVNRCAYFYLNKQKPVNHFITMRRPLAVNIQNNLFFNNISNQSNLQSDIQYLQ